MQTHAGNFVYDVFFENCGHTGGWYLADSLMTVGMAFYRCGACGQNEMIAIPTDKSDATVTDVVAPEDRAVYMIHFRTLPMFRGDTFSAWITSVCVYPTREEAETAALALSHPALQIRVVEYVPVAF